LNAAFVAGCVGVVVAFVVVVVADVAVEVAVVVPEIGAVTEVDEAYQKPRIMRTTTTAAPMTIFLFIRDE
jgi:hypothetical protein